MEIWLGLPLYNRISSKFTSLSDDTNVNQKRHNFGETRPPGWDLVLIEMRVWCQKGLIGGVHLDISNFPVSSGNPRAWRGLMKALTRTSPPTKPDSQTIKSRRVSLPPNCSSTFVQIAFSQQVSTVLYRPAVKQAQDVASDTPNSCLYAPSL